MFDPQSVPFQIKDVHSGVPYQWAITQKYDRRGRESLSGYGPLGASVRGNMSES